MADAQSYAAARMAEVQPDVQRWLDMIAQAPSVTALSVEDARAGVESAAAIGIDMPDVDETRTDIAGIPVRLFRPKDVGADIALPVLIYAHGGGWLLRGLESFGPICATIAAQAGICVVMVDYRLSPEYVFPAALDDIDRVTDAVMTGSLGPGIDPERVAIGGDSAGANMAAVTCLLRRDRGQPTPRIQMLLYPVLDMRLDTQSYHALDVAGMSADVMRWFLSHHLPQNVDVTDPRISPLLAADHHRLPPAYIMTCGLDAAQEDGFAYARALEQAGVSVEQRHYGGQIHAFLMLGKMIGQVAPALTEIASVARKALTR